jgi:hypothetical protein
LVEDDMNYPLIFLLIFYKLFDMIV